MEDLNAILAEAKAAMDRAMQHLDHELAKVRTGKASPVILQDLMVEYYGSPTPLPQVANIQIADARTLSIQPWERNMLGPIERAIINANLGMTPSNDGEVVRISIPALTEERRKELVKKAKHAGEESKVGIRNARHKALEQIKKAVKNGTPEDLGKRKEAEVQDMVKKYETMVDNALATKEKDIMTV